MAWTTRRAGDRELGTEAVEAAPERLPEKNWTIDWTIAPALTIYRRAQK